MPAELAAATAFGPPVVQIRSTPSWWKRCWETSRVGIGNHLQGIRRKPRGLACLLEDLDRLDRALRRPRRRPEDHRVAGLGSDDRLEQGGRGRVGDRDQGQHDADRLGDVLDAPLVVLLDHADRLLVLEVVVEELGGDEVLDDLVLEHPEVGLLHRQRGQLEGVLETGHDHGPDDPVDGLLIEFAEGLRGGFRPLDEIVDALGLFGLER